jgi:hypothetical protein
MESQELTDGVVTLVPWVNSTSAVKTILKYWDRLLIATSAATLPGAPDLTEFSKACILFAAVEVTILPPPEKKPSETDEPPENSSQKNEPATPASFERVGCVFLSTTAYEHELSLGIVLKPRWTGKGYGTRACELALSTAFDTLKFHRVSAVILDSPDRLRAQQFFVNLYVSLFSIRC